MSFDWLNLLPSGFGLVVNDDRQWSIVDSYGDEIDGPYHSIAFVISYFLMHGFWVPEEIERCERRYQLRNGEIVDTYMSFAQSSRLVEAFGDSVHEQAQLINSIKRFA